mmetsp:Transcript_49121/g.122016  ORF Transcript_49121/g.122016 Transcript_49121/m.122016 type:complete len:159 (-) Transcript_49121:1156-1632(-)
MGMQSAMMNLPSPSSLPRRPWIRNDTEYLAEALHHSMRIAQSPVEARKAMRTCGAGNASRSGKFGLDNGQLELRPVRLAGINAYEDTQLVERPDRDPRGGENIELVVESERILLVAGAEVHDALDAVPGHEHNDAVLTYLNHVCVLGNFPLLEEQESE